ncbi:type I-E CRISPR-associated protein Cas6/Cse3/CasE [Streptomyces sp. CWNU-1]|uniref:Type I-E CRISPR-associated protein Cas6/Cse3/CasE n=1 Tax=Streptomyces albipurpureus TaxID=2897419 RepID=A0ABT0UTY1_9ACTN|nr:type I-E CRISPR-associated protein Cas6/Cse3/CasE [Streptomyces sp. CWNU-1]
MSHRPVRSRLPPDTSRLPSGYTTQALTRAMQPMLTALRTSRALPPTRQRRTVLRAQQHSREMEAGHPPTRCRSRPVVGRTLPSLRTSSARTTTHSEPAACVSTRHDETIRINRSAVLFEEAATLRELGALRTALLQGIGRSKSYGCGMLSLAPAGTGR